MGPRPDHQWDGTRLRFEEPDGRWGKWVDLVGPRGAQGSGGGVRPFTPATVNPATDEVPTGFLVEQSGQWAMATLDQMLYWLGGTGPSINVTVNGEDVTVGGELVTVS